MTFKPAKAHEHVEIALPRIEIEAILWDSWIHLSNAAEILIWTTSRVFN